jgi:hypothetical protein
MRKFLAPLAAVTALSAGCAAEVTHSESHKVSPHATTTQVESSARTPQELAHNPAEVRKLTAGLNKQTETDLLGGHLKTKLALGMCAVFIDHGNNGTTLFDIAADPDVIDVPVSHMKTDISYVVAWNPLSKRLVFGSPVVVDSSDPNNISSYAVDGGNQSGTAMVPGDISVQSGIVHLGKQNGVYDAQAEAVMTVTAVATGESLDKLKNDSLVEGFCETSLRRGPQIPNQSPSDSILN